MRLSLYIAAVTMFALAGQSDAIDLSSVSSIALDEAFANPATEIQDHLNLSQHAKKTQGCASCKAAAGGSGSKKHMSSHAGCPTCTEAQNANLAKKLKAAKTMDGIRRGVLALQEAKVVGRHKAHSFQPRMQRMMMEAQMQEQRQQAAGIIANKLRNQQQQAANVDQVLQSQQAATAQGQLNDAQKIVKNQAKIVNEQQKQGQKAVIKQSKIVKDQQKEGQKSAEKATKAVVEANERTQEASAKKQLARNLPGANVVNQKPATTVAPAETQATVPVDGAVAPLVPGVPGPVAPAPTAPAQGQNQFSYLTKNGKTANISNVNQHDGKVEFDAAFINTAAAPKI